MQLIGVDLHLVEGGHPNKDETFKIGQQWLEEVVKGGKGNGNCQLLPLRWRSRGSLEVVLEGQSPVESETGD